MNGDLIMESFNPEAFHKEYLKKHRPLLVFDENSDYFDWKSKVKSKFDEVICRPEKVIESKPFIKHEKEVDGHTEIRFTFESEPGYFVPCHLLIPKNAPKPCPLMICVAGHSSGVHVYMGIHKYDDDPDEQEMRKFARGLVSLEYGYASLMIEQRSFGECEGYKENQTFGRCHQNAMQALLLGRTMIGERSFDVSRAIDVVENYFSDIVDVNRIAISGGSGGGTISYYASCVEPRIAASFPACAFSTVEASIFSLFHCQCNFMPNMLKYFEMADLACLIAPRPLIIFGGEKDPIFPFEAAMSAYKNVVEKIYEKEGVPQKCRYIHADYGHEFRPEIAFPVFAEVTGWR